MAPPRGRKSSKVERRASRPRAVHKREKKRVYAEDWDDLDEADVALPRAYSLDQKLSCDRFTSEAVIELNGNEFNLEWVQRHGLSSPLLFRSTEGLGMKVPRADFTIDDVRTCVGSRRLLDVMDVNTQKNTQMTMKQWQRYYDSPSKDRLLNVISLEFSHTKLEKHVVAPTVVRQLDWVDCVWPRELKQLQTESTNALDEMMYPKVQKYCLMSVGGCFTDFHIDFGGTSVWYHVLRGKKYFWLIPPSEENIRMYEKWVLSGKQADIFFGDLVTQCSLVCLTSGHTFFIPTGWIHAVYTPEDSLVFGGNFLHSFGIETQIRVYKMEDITKVELKYRYPFFVEMLWYTLQRYVQCCLGSCQLSLALHELPELAEFEQLFQQQQQHHLQLLRKHRKHVHLTQFELRGIKAIVMFLHELPQCRKSVPSLIADPAALIGHVRDLVRLHRRDSPHRAVTGQPTLFWPDNGQAFVRLLRSLSKTASRNQSSVDAVVTESPVKPAAKHTPAETPVTDSPVKVFSTGSSSKTPAADSPVKVFSTDPSSKTSDTSSRRVQCRKCAGCKADGCGSCDQCLDTNKLARHKQRCVKRVCTKPRLPASSVCALCGLSEQQPAPMPANVSSLHTSTPLGLFECHRCLVVSHMLCTFSQNPSLGCGLVDGTCPASWVCPACLMGSESSQSHRGGLLPQSDGGVSYSLLSKQLGCVDVSVTLPQLALEDALAAPKHRIEHTQPTETAAVTAGISQTEAETGAAVTAETATAITAETTTGMSQTKAETAAAVKVEIAAEVAGISQVEADTAARMSPTEAETTAEVPTQRMEMSQIEAENATEINAETVTQAELTTKAETAEMPSTEIETTPREAETAPTAADTTEAETAPTAADTTEAETAPTAAEITPTEAEATEAEADIIPTEAEADTTPTEAETAPTEADATEAEATEAEADTTPTETETAPTATEITPTEVGADTSPTEADTTPTEAEVTETDTTPTEAEATEAEADATITEAAAETTPIEAEMAAEAKSSPTEAETTLTEAETTETTPIEAETTLRVLETTEAAAETSPFGAEIAAGAKASPTEAETTTESETAATEAETTPTEVETTPTELEPTMTESESVIETRYCAVAREAVEICEDRNEAEKMSVGCVSDSKFARSESDGVICPTGSTSGYSNGSNTNIADVIPHPSDASSTIQSDDASSLQQSDEYSQPSCIHRQGQFNPDSPPFHQVSNSFCQVTDSPPREVSTSPPHEVSTASLHEVGSSSLFEVGISPPHEIISSPPREVSTFSLHEISSSPPREVNTSPLHEISSSPPREVTVSPPHEVTVSPPREVTVSPPHEVIVSPPREVTVSPPHEVTVSPPREVTVSPPREVNVSPPHEVISPPRDVTVSPPHKVTASPPREVNVSPPREVTVSSPHKVTASPPREVNVSPPRESICSRSPSPPVLQPNFYEQWLSGDECSLSSSSAVSAAAPQLSPMSPHTP